MNQFVSFQEAEAYIRNVKAKYKNFNYAPKGTVFEPKKYDTYSKYMTADMEELKNVEFIQIVRSPSFQGEPHENETTTPISNPAQSENIQPTASLISNLKSTQLGQTPIPTSTSISKRQPKSPNSRKSYNRRQSKTSEKSTSGSGFENDYQCHFVDDTAGSRDLPSTDAAPQKNLRMTLNNVKKQLECAAKNVQECINGIDADWNILNGIEAKLQASMKENEDLTKEVTGLKAQISELKKNEGKKICLEYRRYSGIL